MVDKILENAGTVVALSFAAVGLLLFVVSVLVNITTGRVLDSATFDLLKTVILSAMSFAFGGSVAAAVQRSADKRTVQSKPVTKV